MIHVGYKSTKVAVIAKQNKNYKTPNVEYMICNGYQLV